ncbi:calcium channel protein, variant 2 [Basidiobolus ranarum]|uniref:Calcium channel protein, variant 2 n=1 Tax=Basidiobolus ranarum TaxID=34480 RepID=A0ABR2X1U4_9FUNG
MPAGLTPPRKLSDASENHATIPSNSAQASISNSSDGENSNCWHTELTVENGNPSTLESPEVLLNSTSNTPAINLISTEPLQPAPSYFDTEHTRAKISFTNNTIALSERERFSPRNHRLGESKKPFGNLVISTSNLSQHTITEHEETDMDSPYTSTVDKSSINSPTSEFLDPLTNQRNSIDSREFIGSGGSSTSQLYYPNWEQSPGETVIGPIFLSSGVGTGSQTPDNRRQRTARQSLANLVISASSRVVGSHESSDSPGSDSSNPSSPIELANSEVTTSQPPEAGRNALPKESQNTHPSIPSPLESGPAIERSIRLEGNSLYIFSPTNKLRQALSRILIYRWTEPFVCFLILLNWGILALSSRKESDKFVFGDTWEDYAQLCIYSLFTLECATRIIVYGLIFDPKPPKKDFSSKSSFIAVHPEKTISTFNSSKKEGESMGKSPGRITNPQASLPRAFLRHSYNRLDLIVVISFWVDLVLTLVGDGRFTLFKGLCALRPIRLLMLTGGLSVIQSSLKMSFPILVTVTMFICYFFVLFGIIGVHAFKGSLSRRCFLVDENGKLGIPALPERTCGGWYNGTKIMAVTDGLDDLSKGYTCPNGQICTNIENPEHGLVNFDNIFYATLNVFVVIATEGWTDIMYYAMDAEYGMFTAVYFCALIFIITFFIIQLFIASIVDTFAKIRANNKNRSAFTLNKPTRILKDTADGWTIVDDKQHAPNRNRIRRALHKIVYNQIFPYCGALAVAVDLISMSLRNVNSSPDQLIVLDHIEIIFTVLFAVEILLRFFAAVSFRQFWRQLSNRVDLFLAIATCIVITPYIRSRSIYRYFTAFQVIRSYRVVLCAPRVGQLVRKVFGSAMGIWNLLLYTVFFILFATSVAEQLFSGSFDFPDQQDDPYLTFDTIGEGFVALFQILTGENWTDILWDTMRSQNGIMIFVGAVFCVVFYFYSHFIIVNLFVAVFLENFEMEEEEKRLQQVHNYVHRSRGKSNLSRISPLLRNLNPYRHLKPSPELIKVPNFPSNMALQVRKNYFKQFLIDTSTSQCERKDSPKSVIGNSRLFKLFSCWGSRKSNRDSIELHPYQTVTTRNSLLGKNVVDQPFSYTQLIDQPQYPTLMEAPIRARKRRNSTFLGQSSASYVELRNESDEESDFQENHPMHNRALFILPPQNRLRLFCQGIVGSNKESFRSYFDWFILVCIFGSVVTAAIDNPIHRKYNYDLPVEEQTNIFHHLDIFFVVISTLEFTLRVLADGLLFTPNAYLLNGWNQLDFVVLVLYYISVIGQITEFSLLSRAIRASRALRPLRLIRQFKGMKEIMVSMLRGLPKIIDATILSLLFIIPFAIYGVTLFSGYFNQCNDKSVSGFFDCSGEYWHSYDEDGSNGVLIPRVWGNPYTHNFDSFGSAMLTLFTMASGEGWIEALFHGMSIPIDPEIQPKYLPYDKNWYNWIYFVVYMLFGSVFAIQLFIGISVEIFKNRSGMSLLTVEQRQWVDLQLQLKMVKPSKHPFRPSSSFAGWCFDILYEKRNRFSTIITSIMMLNVVVMMTEAWGQPRWVDNTRNFIYGAFALVYMFEISVKLCGSGFQRWYKSRWNIYDAIVTLGVALTVIFRMFRFQANILIQFQKIFLIGVAIRVFHKIESLKTLLQALVSSLPSILSITGLYALVLVIYSILFQEIFGLVKYGVDTTPNSNFRSFGNSLLMAIRMTTGENWHVVMFDMMVEPPFCVRGTDVYLDSDCGSTLWSLLLFISFYVICTYIFLNMFIVIVIGSFTYIYNSNSALELISKEDLIHWKRTWAEFDPQATGYISPEDLVPFFNKLSGKFRVKVFDPEYSITQLKAALNTPDTTPKPYEAQPSRFPQFNIRLLNQRLSTLDLATTRDRRHQFNQIYQEAMMIRERRGIPFAQLLRIFSYRLIDVEQFLGVAELLDRKEVDHAILGVWAIEKVRGILKTIVQRRKFLQKEPNLSFNTPISLKIPRIIINEGTGLTDTEEHSPVSSGSSSPISPVSPYLTRYPSHSSSPGSGPEHRQSLGEYLPPFPGVDSVDLDSSNILLSPNQANTILMTMSANRWFGK